MARFRLQLFDTFQLEVAERPITAVYSDKVRLLLAYLCVEANQPHSRQKLASLFWSEQSESKARTNLRNSLVHLRRCLQPLLLDNTLFTFNRQTLQFHTQTDQAQVDVLTFTAAITIAETHDHASVVTCDSCCQQLGEAVALYQGDFLATLTLKDSPPFEEWRRQWQERLHQQILWACQQLADYFQKQTNYKLAAHYARRQLQLEAWREVAHRQLMLALALAGQKTAALQQYELCRQVLADELDIEPTVATQQLYQQIKVGAKPGQVPHNLPRQTTPFVGREADILQLQTLWEKPENGLVTIVGPGGMGKTRLGLSLAEQMLATGRFTHGVFFVNLAPLSEASYIVPTVADILNFPLQGGDGRSPRQQLLDYLHHKKILLLFDNFEHLLGGVDLLTDILQAAPEVQILVTSRERLHIRAEQVYPIKGLAFPDWDMISLESEVVAGYTAVQLFLQSARRNQPDFALHHIEDLVYLARICHTVAGMPLALELAASWVDMMPLADIATELEQGLDFLETDMRDIPQRHRSIRTALDYSWHKLDEKERAIFTKLSVFRGGFTREAAQAVAGANLRQLARLVNKSLLQGGWENGRYQVHELLRQYGTEKLKESGQETAVCDHHATYYSTFLQQRQAAMKSADVIIALMEIKTEIDNVRRAWEWTIERDHMAALLQAVECLGWFYYWQARHQEGIAAFNQAAEKMETIIAQSAHPTDQRLHLWAILLGWQGQYAAHSDQSKEARQLCQKALVNLAKLERRHQDIRLEKAFVLEVLGTTHGFSGHDNMSASIAIMEQSLATYRELKDQWGIAYLLIRLANLNAWYAHDYALAESQCLASWPLTKALGHPIQMVWSCLTLGRVTARQGRAIEAEDWLKQGQTISLEIDYFPGLFNGLLYSAEATFYQGRFFHALTFLEKALTLRSDLDFGSISEGWVEEYQSWACLHLGRYQEAHALAGETITKYSQRGNIKGIAFGRWLLATSYFIQGENQNALTLLQQSAQTCHETGEKSTLNLVKITQSYILQSTGYRTRAQQLLGEVLDFGLNHRSYIHILMAIPVMTLLLSTDGQKEHAVELYALATSHTFVGNSHWFSDVVGQEIEAIATLLLPEVVGAAQARGRELDLWQTAESLLTELAEMGWAESVD